MSFLYDNLETLPEGVKGSVLLIGNFDGVHKGHKALLEIAKSIAAPLKTKVGVLTFNPHPRIFFKKHSEHFCITSLATKVELLKAAGADFVIPLKFDEKLAALSADEFINLLTNKIGVKHIIVGQDFCFGRGREGNVATLQAAAKKSQAFSVTVAASIKDEESIAYSSSKIRELLRQGDFAGAEKLLGWQWYMEAEVVAGDKRGRTIGFPTANQNIGSYIEIPYGVYASKVLIAGENVWRRAVTNFGIRPTFALKEPIFETYIFDFSGDIYGRAMKVMPFKFLRSEAKFDGLDALKKQIEDDCIKALSVLK